MSGISQQRLDDLHDLFWSESNEEWTQKWRDGLTTEESALIDTWDNAVDQGMYNICKRILELDAQRKERQS